MYSAAALAAAGWAAHGEADAVDLAGSEAAREGDQLVVAGIEAALAVLAASVVATGASAD